MTDKRLRIPQALVNDVITAKEALRAKDLSESAASAALQTELVSNVYPLFEAIAKQSLRQAQLLVELDGVVDELTEQEDSFLHDEDAGVLAAALAAAEEIVKHVQPLLIGQSIDDLVKKKIGDAIAVFQHTIPAATEVLQNATADEEDEEADESEDAASEEDENA